MDNQSQDFNYFINNHDALLHDYRNKFVVISNQKVCCAADTFELALEQALKDGLELGNFIIQQCTEGDSAYTQMFHSRAVFA